MAHLHNFASQAGVIMGNIGQKIKLTAEIAGDIKLLYDTGMFFKNALTAVGPLAAVAL